MTRSPDFTQPTFPPLVQALAAARLRPDVVSELLGHLGEPVTLLTRVTVPAAAVRELLAGDVQHPVVSGALVAALDARPGGPIELDVEALLAGQPLALWRGVSEALLPHALECEVQHAPLGVTLQGVLRREEDGSHRFCPRITPLAAGAIARRRGMDMPQSLQVSGRLRFLLRSA